MLVNHEHEFTYLHIHWSVAGKVTAVLSKGRESPLQYLEELVHLRRLWELQDLHQIFVEHSVKQQQFIAGEGGKREINMLNDKDLFAYYGSMTAVNFQKRAMCGSESIDTHGLVVLSAAKETAP